MWFRPLNHSVAAVLAVAYAQDGYWEAPVYVEPVCPKTIKYVCGFKEVQGPYGLKREYKTFDNRCKLDAENLRVYYTRKLKVVGACGMILIYRNFMFSVYKPLIKIEGYTCDDLGY